jgi:uncharacterized protein DUF4279
MNVSDEEISICRFYLDLFIVHPSIDPGEITAALGLEPSNVHRFGDRRATPKGRLLEGTYPDSSWIHSVRHEIKGRFFANKIDEFLNRLLPHRDFLHQLRSTGGQATLIVYFIDGYFADSIANKTLSKVVELQMDWGIECLMTPEEAPDGSPARAAPSSLA